MGYRENQTSYWLATIVFYSSAVFLIWLNIDTRPPAYDEAGYYFRSLSIADAAQESPSEFLKSIFGLGKYGYPMAPYRGFFPMLSAMFLLLCGRTADSAMMANLPSVILLLLVVYAIGKHLWDQNVGVLGAFCVSTIPLFYYASRIFMIELTSTFMAALSIYILIKSDYFHDRKCSIFLGIVIGLGVFSKEIYVVSILGPFLCCFGILVYRKEKGRLVNLCLACSIAGILALVFCGPHWKLLKYMITDHSFGEVIALYKLPSKLGFDLLTYYPVIFINNGLSFFYSTVFVVAIIFFAKNKFGNRNRFEKPIMGGKTLVLSWAIVPCILLTATTNKELWYLTILIPPISLIMAQGILSVPLANIRRRIIVCAIVALGFIQFAVHSFPENAFLPKEIGFTANIAGCKLPLVFFEQSERTQPRKENWQTEEIVAKIQTDIKLLSDKKESYGIMIVPDTPRFSWIVFSSYCKAKNLNFDIKPKGDPQFSQLSFSPSINYSTILEGCHYVVVKTGQQGEGDWDKEFMRKYSNNILEKVHEAQFLRMQEEFPLPDGSIAYIYRRKI